MDAFIGTILPCAFDYAPQGWILCHGQSLQISRYQALYALIGTRYGGNGTTTFNVPDLRGRVMIGYGEGANLTPHTIGATGGNETISLNSTNMPPHTHTLMGNSNTAVPLTNMPANTSLLGTPTDSMKKPINIYGNISSTQPTLTAMNDKSIGITGGANGASDPISVMQPFQTINFIMCVEGFWPARE